MKRYRIEYDRESCIGAVSCIQEDPENWTLAKDDMRADLKDSKKDARRTGYFIKEISEHELPIYLKAAKSCPVNVIHIIDIETGEELI